MKIFHVGPHKFRESLRELLRELWLSHCAIRETPFREWDFAFRELFSELRELPRECPGTLRELREWPFHSESASAEIGVVPRLLNNTYREGWALKPVRVSLESLFVVKKLLVFMYLKGAWALGAVLFPFERAYRSPYRFAHRSRTSGY